MKMKRGKKGGFKVWYVTLVISILGFIFTYYFFNQMLGSLHMDTLIDFFALLAMTSVYSYYMAISLFVGIAFLIVSIIFMILRR